MPGWKPLSSLALTVLLTSPATGTAGLWIAGVLCHALMGTEGALQVPELQLKGTWAPGTIYTGCQGFSGFPRVWVELLSGTYGAQSTRGQGWLPVPLSQAWLQVTC